MARYVVGITGASGVIYGVTLVNWMLERGHEIHLVVSGPAQMVLKEELGWEAKNIDGYLAKGTLRRYDNQDFAVGIASGSFQHDGMVVIPCSMSTLSGIVHGSSNNLIERAADVTLKEGRPLILVPRESPLSVIHLRNLLAAAEAGVRIIPAMPAFYGGVAGVEDLINFVVGKVLDSLGLEHDLFRRYCAEHTF